MIENWSIYSSLKKVVNSRYWNRKELWGSSSSSNFLLLALTLHDDKDVQVHHNATAMQ